MKLYESYLLNQIRFYADANNAQRADMVKMDQRIAISKVKKRKAKQNLKQASNTFKKTYCLGPEYIKQLRLVWGQKVGQEIEAAKQQNFEADLEYKNACWSKKYALYWLYYPKSERGIKEELTINTLKKAVVRFVNEHLR